MVNLMGQAGRVDQVDRMIVVGQVDQVDQVEDRVDRAGVQVDRVDRVDRAGDRMVGRVGHVDRAGDRMEDRVDQDGAIGDHRLGVSGLYLAVMADHRPGDGDHRHTDVGDTTKAGTGTMTMDIGGDHVIGDLGTGIL
jgi:hypothetical protein